MQIFKLAPWFVMADEEEENWPEFFENNRLIPVHPNRRKSGSQTKPNQVCDRDFFTASFRKFVVLEIATVTVLNAQLEA